MNLSRTSKLILAATLLYGHTNVNAQEVTADTVLRDIEQRKLREQPLPVFTRRNEPVKELPPLDETKSVLVSEIVFEGNESLSSDFLQNQISDRLGEQMDFARLKAVADRVGEIYQAEGMWAKAILPPQSLENGRLVVHVYEGRLGQVIVEKNIAPDEVLRLSEDSAIKYVTDGQDPEATFDIIKFEEAVKNLNAVPGIQASAVLRAGDVVGNTDVVMNLANTSPATGSFSFDGNGGRATGYNQATASISLDGPFKRGDQITAMAMRSTGLQVNSLGVSLPVGFDGTRAGLNVTKVNLPELGSKTGSYAANVSRPFVQRADLTVNGSATLTRKDTPQEVTADVLALNSVISWPDQFLGLDSVNSVNLTGTAGWFYPKTNLEASTNGLYSKFGFKLNQSLTLNSTDQLVTTLMGQMAFNNLDAGEKFGIAGSVGVRAYPGGELSGDHGYFFSTQYQRQFGSMVLGRAFFDHGFVVKNKNPWNDEASQGNYQQLSGVGVGATWNHPNFTLNADLATRLGRNPVAQDDGTDSDGTKRNVRAWISIMVPFSL